jgi:hypothetical protein
MAEAKMTQGVIPKFSSEAKEAAWWDGHRSEIEAEIRQRIKQQPLTLGNLAKRISAEINERAAKMTPEDRAKADAETKKIAARVRRRTL